MDITKSRIIKELNLYDVYFEDNMAHFIYNGNRVSVLVGTNYPFTPPVVFINDNRIAYNYSLFPKRLWDTYVQHYKECKCCSNKSCPNNWSPALTIIHVLKEYEEFKETLKTFQKIKMFQYSSLPDDIIREINTYLLK